MGIFQCPGNACIQVSEKGKNLNLYAIKITFGFVWVCNHIPLI
jgi:hypothetical protein